MISHKFKFIFIHIPRTGGSSIEKSLCGKDWWRIEKTTKHIIASTAKKIYEDHWDDYFKFSFVRNPWDRMLSMSKFASFYGCFIKNQELDVSGYFKKFPKIEVDPRSKSAKEKFSPIADCVYQNILNEELDFVGRFENLQEDYNHICKAIGAPIKKLPHSQKSKHKHYSNYYNSKTKKIVTQKYLKDIRKYNYIFEKYIEV